MTYMWICAMLPHRCRPFVFFQGTPYWPLGRCRASVAMQVLVTRRNLGNLKHIVVQSFGVPKMYMGICAMQPYHC